MGSGRGGSGWCGELGQATGLGRVGKGEEKRRRWAGPVGERGKERYGEREGWRDRPMKHFVFSFWCYIIYAHRNRSGTLCDMTKSLANFQNFRILINLNSWCLASWLENSEVKLA